MCRAIPPIRTRATRFAQDCHSDNWNDVSCNSTKWKEHLPKGRVAQSVWEYVSQTKTGSTCGW